MDVDQLRKINEMSKTLQKHGLAQTSEEGSRIAGSMMDEDVPGREGSAPAAVSKQSNDNAELLIERHARKVQQQLEALYEKITQLETKVAMQEQQLRTPRPVERVVINDVPAQASQFSTPNAPNMQQQSQQPVQGQPVQTQPAPVHQQPPAQQSLGRGQGATPQLKSDPDNFDLEEITVEKMFYYGNK